MPLRFVIGMVLLTTAMNDVLAAAPPSSATDTQPEAVAWFKESLVAYRAGRFRDAAELLEKAYALRPKPVLLYNLGRAFEGMGELGRAVTAYTGYLEGDPTAPDAMSIQARIETLKLLIEERERLEAERKAAVARAEAQAEKSRQADLHRRYAPAPWILAGGGVLGLVAASAVAGTAYARNDSASSLPTQAAAQARVDEAHRLALGANITFGLGGALAIAGGIWGVVDIVHVRRARARAAHAGAR